MGLSTVTKTVVMIDQASTTNAATATGNCDTLGYGYATIDVRLATSNAATNNPTVFNLLESDDTVASNFATISGFVGDTDWTIASGTSATSTKMNVDLRGRKRYLRLAISPLTTQVITAIANLSKGNPSAVGTTAAGVDALVAG